MFLRCKIFKSQKKIFYQIQPSTIPHIESIYFYSIHFPPTVSVLLLFRLPYTTYNIYLYIYILCNIFCMVLDRDRYYYKEKSKGNVILCIFQGMFLYSFYSLSSLNFLTTFSKKFCFCFLKEIPHASRIFTFLFPILSSYLILFFFKFH